jgi:hypothetical protein
MTLQEFMNTQYNKASDNEDRTLDIYKNEKDKLSALACDFESGNNRACGNYAAAFAKLARSHGVPSGMFYQQETGHESGHMRGWMLMPDGTIAVSSNNKVEFHKYGSLQEMFDSVKSEAGKASFFTDSLGNYLTDKSTEDSWKSETLGAAQKIFGSTPAKNGGTVTEAERERFSSTIFKHL